ncbi:MAG: TetR/AcrR family transcriptional regulator [Oscillospiraceae bacterium]|nr:TetR/AcrR family transcriptional regulator [Oscillospiraceae bacterium]
MAGNKQSERSKKWIEDALLSLMEDRHFQAVSVKDIADKAGVSRLTFYRNFETKENVLLRYFDGLFYEYLATVRELAPCPLEKALVLCLDTWKKHKRESGLLLRDDLGALLHKPFDRYLNQALGYIELPHKLTETQKQFVIGGMYFTMLDWLADDRGRSSRQVAREIVDFVKLR